MSCSLDFVAVRNLKRFPGHAIKRPISDALAAPGKPHVFRHAVLCAGFPYVLAECSLSQRDRAICRSPDREIRTFSQTDVTRVMLIRGANVSPWGPTKATRGLASELHQERGERFAERFNSRLLLHVCK